MSSSARRRLLLRIGSRVRFGMGFLRGAVLAAMTTIAGTSEGADDTSMVAAVRRTAAQIHVPGAKAKIRPGDVVDVIVSVAAPDDSRWQVSFVDDQGASVQVLAEGSGEVRRQRVATIGNDVVAPGSRGTLRLEVSSEGSTAESRMQISAPDPTYVAIPVDEGNMSRRRFNTYQPVEKLRFGG